ncbi:MAG: tail fiber domain-containing protein [Flavobacteriales bacterium]|nr:tail fiber domain-containing protein [Flavobacteriales bacterium]
MSKYINPEQSFRSYHKGGGKGGGGGGGGGGVSPEVMEMAKKGNFKPFTLTTSAGESFGDGEGKFGAQAASPFSDLQAQALQGAGGFLTGITDQFNRPAGEFNFNSDVNAAQQDLFASQSALLQPAFQQQNDMLKSNMLGGGRMGLQVNGQNPDVFGLGEMQNQQLAQLASSTRQQALGEQAQAYGMDSSTFGINQGLQQQRGQNLMQGFGALFGTGSAVADQELALLQAGSNAEAMRGQSYIGAAGALAAGMQPPEKSGGGKGLLGSAIGAAGNVAAAKVSDMRLKDNIVKVGELPNGLNLYTWTWNDKAKEAGLDTGIELGVMAQEVLEVLPSAVIKGEDGYLRVNYSEVLNG